MTAHVQSVSTPTRPQNHLDHICFQRLQAANFAQHQSTISRLINRIKAGAK